MDFQRPVGPGTAESNTLGLWSMIIGIASIPLVFCLALGLPAGIVAVVLGIIGKRRVEDGLATNRGQATAGIICGAIGSVLTVVAIFIPSAAELSG